MPIYARFGKGYEGPERVCPSCGARPGFTPSRCGPVAMFAMRIAWGAAFLAVIIFVALDKAVAELAWTLLGLFWRDWGDFERFRLYLKRRM